MSNSERFIGACGEYVAGVSETGLVPTPNKVFNSMYRVCNVDDTQNAACVYLPSRHLKHEMCPPQTPPQYYTYASKASGYATPTPNPKLTPGCFTWTVLADERDAQRACDAQPKCTGIYRTDPKKASSFALAVAPPGKCAVDWARLPNSEPDACVRFLGADFEQRDGDDDFYYCRPKCDTTRDGVDCPSAHCAPGWAPYGDQCMPTLARCPPGWTVAGAQCLPPCAGARKDGGWCKPVAGACPEAYQEYYSACVPAVGRIKAIEGTS